MIHGLNVLYPEAEWPSFPVKHVRLWDMGIHWGALHIAPAAFDFTRMDAIVRKARASGTTNLTYCVSATPTWLSVKPDGTTQAPWLNPGSNYPPFSMLHFTDFMLAIMDRYRGQIGSYQIWNEPQLPWFWQPKPMAAVAEMTRLARQAAREVDPGVKIVAAPMVASMGPARYVRLLDALRGKRWPVDVWSAHIYTKPGEGPEEWRSRSFAWRRVLHGANAPKRPRWVTETNVNFMGGPVPPERVEPWVRAIDKVAEDEQTAKVYWYAYGTHTDPSLLGIPLYEGSEGARVLAPMVG